MPASFFTKAEWFFRSNQPPGFDFEVKFETRATSKESLLTATRLAYSSSHYSRYWFVHSRNTLRILLTVGPLISDTDCPHCLCLCNPCVISMPLDLLNGSGPPELRNTEKHFHCLGAAEWSAGVGAPRKVLITALIDTREIMPKCVVQVSIKAESKCL